MNKGYARLTPVDADGVRCGDDICLTDAVEFTSVDEGHYSVSLPKGATLSEYYCVEMWIPRASVDGTEPGPYTYVTTTNSPELREKWEQDFWENIAALKNSHGRQVQWPSADAMRPYMGKWIAILDGEIIHVADTVKGVVQYLVGTDREADSILRVPTGEYDER